MSLLRRRCWGTEDEDLVLGLWGWNGAEHVAGCSGGERHSVMWSDACGIQGTDGVGGGPWKKRTQISCSMVTEKLVSPYTLFQEKREASFFSLETIPFLRLKLEWGKEVLEEWDPPGEERNCWK